MALTRFSRFKLIDDRAVRTAVALASVGQMFECTDHVLKLSSPELKLGDVFKGHLLDVRTAAPFVTPKLQEFTHLLKRKAEVTCTANKAKAVDIARRVIPVASFGPARLRYQIDRLVVPDHLCGDAGSLRCLTDIHVAVTFLGN